MNLSCGVSLVLLFAVSATAQLQRVAVTPSAIDFGGLDVGRSAEVQVQIANVGGLPLTVTRLSVDDDRFSVDSQGPFTFPPGNFWVVGVIFAPRAPGRADGILSIDTDDPAQPTVEVPLTGVGLGGELEVAPTSVAFDDVPVGEERTSDVSLRNVGTAPIVVGIVPPPDARFRASPTGLVTIDASGSREVTVTFAPDADGSFASALQIQPQDPNGQAIAVSLAGRGVRRRVGFDVDVSPTDVRLEPGSVAPVSYTFTETEGLAIDILGGDAYLERSDGRRVDLQPRPLSRRLDPNGSTVVDDVVLLPDDPFDDGIIGPVRFVRMFTGTSDGREVTRESVVTLVPTGSLGADFAITTISVDAPTAGATVSLGTPLRGRAIVFGSGSGSALGAWIVNGLRVETFSVDLTGGRPVEIETLISLPTGILGLHEVQIQIDEPTRILSRVLPYLVIPRVVESMRWTLEEGFRTFLRGGRLAAWAWTPTTAVGRYDVRIDGASVDRTRRASWEMPAAVGASLGAGEHSIEIVAGDDRVDPSLEPFERARLEGRFAWLDGPAPLEARCADSRCRWDGPAGDGLFRVEILDASTGRAVYRKVTRLRDLSISDVRAEIAERGPFRWLVHALNPHGESVARSDLADWPEGVR